MFIPIGPDSPPNAPPAKPPTAATGASSPSATEPVSPTPTVTATWTGLSDEETNVGSLSTRSATGPESPEETEEEKKEAEHNESSGCDADDFPEKITLSTVERTFWVDSPAYYESTKTSVGVLAT